MYGHSAGGLLWLAGVMDRGPGDRLMDRWEEEKDEEALVGPGNVWRVMDWLPINIDPQGSGVYTPQEPRCWGRSPSPSEAVTVCTSIIILA